MKIDWKGVTQEITQFSPALRGRLIRHVLTLLAGAGFVKGLTADQTNALQGLIEISLSVIVFGLTLVLSHTSDEKQKAEAAIKPLTEEQIEALIREVQEDEGPSIDCAAPPRRLDRSGDDAGGGAA